MSTVQKYNGAIPGGMSSFLLWYTMALHNSSFVHIPEVNLA